MPEAGNGLQKTLVVFIIITWSLAILVVLNTVSLNSRPQNTIVATLIIAAAIIYYFIDSLKSAKDRLRQKISSIASAGKRPLQND